MDCLVYTQECEFCDKCGEPVPEHNDIRTLEAKRLGNPMILFLHARHLLPVVRDGNVVCPGSPSRAQYLPGQPRDDRGYRYVPEDEASYRAAWDEMRGEAN